MSTYNAFRGSHHPVTALSTLANLHLPLKLGNILTLRKRSIVMCDQTKISAFQGKLRLRCRGFNLCKENISNCNWRDDNSLTSYNCVEIKHVKNFARSTQRPLRKSLETFI